MSFLKKASLEGVFCYKIPFISGIYFSLKATLDSGKVLEASPLKSRTNQPFPVLFNFLAELLAYALRQENIAAN